MKSVAEIIDHWRKHAPVGYHQDEQDFQDTIAKGSNVKALCLTWDNFSFLINLNASVIEYGVWPDLSSKRKTELLTYTHVLAAFLSARVVDVTDVPFSE